MLLELTDSINQFLDWVNTLTLSSIVDTYWFLFFIEMPRYYILEYIVIGSLMFRYKSVKKEKDLARSYLLRENPLVSILVPGKNEGKHIYKLVKTLKEQTYQNYELIVVDDGSDDDTKLICDDLVKAGYLEHYFRLET